MKPTAKSINNLPGIPVTSIHMLLVVLSLFVATPFPVFGVDAVWLLNPGSGVWNTGTNWSTSPIAPVNAGDTATFNTSAQTLLIFSGNATVESITFNPGASAFRIFCTNGNVLTVQGAGIMNSSGKAQTIAIEGANSSTGTAGSFTDFLNTSSAGNATIINDGGLLTGDAGGTTVFRDRSSAGSATIIDNGESGLGGAGGTTEFLNTSSAGSATINNDGGITSFRGKASAGNAAITTTAGLTEFTDNSDGGTARAITNGDGSFDISRLTTSGMGIGSIEGSGNYFLGSKMLTVGGNDLSTSVSGVIQDGGLSGGVGGSLTKVGTGNLILLRENTYSGGTNLNGGTVEAFVDKNLGTGPLSFNGGTLEARLVVEGTGFESSKAITLNAGGGTFLADSATVSTLGGPISGIGAWTKTGPGTLILGGTNTYTGATTVSAGVLRAGSEGAFSVDSAFTVNTGAELDLNGFNNAVGSLSGSGLVTNSESGSEIGFPATLSVGADKTSTTFSGLLEDGTTPVGRTLGLTKVGTGTLTLTGANTYSGGTNLNGGILAVNSDGNLGTGPLSFNGGTLEALFVVEGPGLFSNKAITLNSRGGTFFADSGTVSTLTGPISGVGAWTKTGPGTLILDGNNTYSGGTNLNGGILAVNSDGNLGSGSLSFNGGTLEALFVVEGPGFESSKAITLNFGGGTFLADSGTVSTLTGPISGVGAWTKTGPGTLILGGTNTYTGATTVSAGVLRAGSEGAFSVGSAFTVNTGAELDLNGFNNAVGSLSGSGLVTNSESGSEIGFPATLSVGADNTSTTFSGLLEDGTTPAGRTLGLTKVGTGTLTLTGANTYSGGTNLNGGILAVNSDGNLGTGPLSFNGGTLEALFVVEGPGLFSNKAITLNSRGGTFLADSGTVSTLAGPISGVGAWAKTGPGTLILGGTNTYTGATTVSAGVLRAGSEGAFSVGSAFTINTGAELDLNGFSNTVGSLSGSGLVTNTGIANPGPNIGIAIETGRAPATLSVGADNTNTTFDGLLQDGQSTLGLTKVGSGTLTLTGANTYSGGTTIRAGTLQLGNGGTTGSIAGDVSDNGILAFNRSNVLTFSGVISGTGSVQQNGIGTTVLLADNTYIGETTVNAGSLIIDGDGSIPSAQTLVNPGGFIGGHGTIRGDLANSGIVSPGDSPGTLTVAGNYTQNTSGTLRIEVASVTVHDLLAVRGHASLAGTLQFISLGGFKLHVGDQLIFLTAKNGISGTFDTVQNPLVTGTIVKSEVVYLPDAIVLEGTQGSFVPVACTPNAVAVAHALDSAVGSSRSAGLINFLDDQPINQLCGDLQLIAPEQLASIFNIGVSLANVQTANLNRRMEEIRAGSTGFSAAGFTLNGSVPNFADGFAGVTGPEGKSGPSALTPTPENRWGVWVTGIGEFTNVDSTENAPGYDLQTGGLTLGVDYRVSPNFAIGLTAGYAHTNADLASGGDLDVNSGSLGLYATVFGGGFYIDTSVTGGPSGYSTHRTAFLGSANGGTDGGDLNVLIAAGYDWKKGDLKIGPTASFQYTYVSFGGFTESGSLAPLDIQSQNAESERSALGMGASYDWKVGRVVIVPQISLAWQHEFGDQAYSIVASFANGAGNNFTVNSPAIGRDSMLIGAGATVLLSERVSIYAYYDGELFRTNYQSNNVSAGIRVTF